MDDFDRASEAEQRELALKEHQHRTRTEPRDECEDCDTPLIPFRRQFGTCITCQEKREARARLYRRD